MARSQEAVGVGRGPGGRHSEMFQTGCGKESSQREAPDPAV